MTNGIVGKAIKDNAGVRWLIGGLFVIGMSWGVLNVQLRAITTDVIENTDESVVIDDTLHLQNEQQMSI